MTETTFKDVEGDQFTVLDAIHLEGSTVNFQAGEATSHGNAEVVLSFDATTARAVAAEIIACADRIEGKATTLIEVYPGAGFSSSDASIGPHGEHLRIPTTPTHTSYESLATLAKAIAYLSPSLREELNALLATRIREVLK